MWFPFVESSHLNKSGLTHCSQGSMGRAAQRRFEPVGNSENLGMTFTLILSAVLQFDVNTLLRIQVNKQLDSYVFTF